MIHRLNGINQTELAELTQGLMLSIQNGASLGFLESVSVEQIKQYWLQVEASLTTNCILMVAKANKEIVGAVQLSLSTKDNGQHRAEVQKLFVLPSYTGQGIATKLMLALEQQARTHNRYLLVLDTQTGSVAEHFYQHCGYVKVGDIPDFATDPKSQMFATSIYYKILAH